MTFATLRALHAIIGDALDDIERAYRDADPSRHPCGQGGNAPSPSTPPYTPPPGASFSSSVSGKLDGLRTPSPSSYSADENALPTPMSVVSVTTLPPPKAPQERKKGRDRARTLPPIATPPLLSPPPPLLLDHNQSSETSEEPLEFPSLDEPRYVRDRDSCKMTQLQDELFTHPQVTSAVNQLVAACGQLSASVQKPFLVLCDAGMGVRNPWSQYSFGLHFLRF